MYRVLDSTKLIGTIAILHERIQNRFPQSGLSKIGRELLEVARQAKVKCDYIKRPNYWLRAGAAAAIVIILMGLHMTMQEVRVVHKLTIAEFIQVLEAGLNDVVLIGAAIFFLITFENRIKREKVLQLLHELRVMAHVVDMHQLTKDPDKMLGNPSDHLYPPKKQMTRFELNRYLDYCSEMLSLIGKIAALYVQTFNDPVIISTVNEIEDLSTGLSRKIWQKIMIVQSYK